MRILAAALVLIVSLLPPWMHADRRATAQGALRVRAAVKLCRSHPSGQYRLWVRGWFVPSMSGDGYLEGGLFDSPRAVPVTTVDQWDVNGNWKRYGALYVRIISQAAFGARSLTLHGRLECASLRFWSDRDPFPAPHLRPVYGTTQRGQNGPATTWVAAGGLKLTLTLLRRTYPRDALVQVRVSLGNVSRHNLGYWTTGVSLPGFASPQAEVLDRSGRIVFPPAMSYAPALPGPVPALERLKPGQTISQSEYIVVRGARIRASQQFAVHLPRNIMPPTNTVATHPITVRLTVEHAPQLTLHRSSHGPTVDVIRPPNVSGQMMYLGYADCGFTSFDYTFSWVPSGLHLRSGCSPVQAWHVRVGWLNHPIAGIDYVSPRPSPAPTPLPTRTSTPVPTGTLSTPTQVVPSFGSVLRRASAAMADVHTLHAEGVHTSRDSSAQMDLHIHSDCRSRNGKGFPVALRIVRSGRYTEPPKPTQRIDEGYILIGPALPGPHAAMRAWERSAATQNRWRSVDLYRQWHLGEGPGDPIFPDPAYLNQVCPDLIRRTFLASPLPYWSHRVMGMQMLGGYPVWHLREKLWSKLDLFIDPTSFRLRRVVLWDGASSAAIRWQVRLDYSHFNGPVHVRVPSGGSRQ